MASSNELIEELISLTRGSLRNVETELSEVRADIRVLSERVKNKNTDVDRIESDFKSFKIETDKKIQALHKEHDDRLKKLENAHAKFIGMAGVVGGVIGFIASLAKGFLGL